jgi:hypothetical protein
VRWTTRVSHMADSGSPFKQRQAKKRRRPALACEQCRQRKVRCDRNSPCSTCIRSENLECTYAPNPPIAARDMRPATPTAGASLDGETLPANSIAYSAPSAAVLAINALEARVHPSSASSLYPARPFSGRTLAPTPSSLASSATTIDSLERRVKQLEKELQSALDRQQSPSETQFTLGRSGQLSPVRMPADSNEIDKTFISLPIRGTISKTRFFGQSHWVNGTNLLPSTVVIPLFLMLCDPYSATRAR